MREPCSGSDERLRGRERHMEHSDDHLLEAEAAEVVVVVVLHHHSLYHRDVVAVAEAAEVEEERIQKLLSA